MACIRAVRGGLTVLRDGNCSAERQLRRQSLVMSLQFPMGPRYYARWGLSHDRRSGLFSGLTRTGAVLRAGRAFNLAGWLTVVAVVATTGRAVAFDCVQNELQKLTAMDAEQLDEFGRAVAADGDVIVIGVSKSGDAGRFSGSVYVFRNNGGVWSEEQKLTASDAEQNDEFGFSVDVDGDVIVVGARRENTEGAGYVFRHNGSMWVEEQKLTAGDGATDDEYGHSISVSGDTVAIGAIFAGVSEEGQVYVYRESGGVWSLEQTLTASDAAADDRFGNSVAIDQDALLVGAQDDDDACVADPFCNSGSAYVFRRTGTTWAEEDKLIASDDASGDTFGFSVALDAGVAVVGSRADDDDGSLSGSAYVFRENAGVWSEEQKLTAMDAAGGDAYGSSVGISGSVIVVGATGDDDAGASSGSGYVYRDDGMTWNETQKLLGSDLASGDRFGFSIGISGDVAIVGATTADVGGLFNSGSSYVFDLTEMCPLTGCMPGDGTCDGACELCDVDGTCRHCRFDLDFDEGGVIGTGDFGIFSGCFGNVYLPGDSMYESCLPSNFDGNVDETTGEYNIGTSDFGLFSACFAMACGDCASCYP